VQRYVSTLAARMRLFGAALRLRAHLPAEMAARLALGPEELKAPDHPTQVAFAKSADPMPCNLRNGGGAKGRAAACGRAGGVARLALRVREVERLAALTEANGQAPWRQAIAFARAAKRAARKARGQVLVARRTERARATGGTARISRSDAILSLPTLEPATGHLTRWGTCPGGEDRRGLGNGGGRQGAEGATPRIKGPGARLFRPTLTRRALVCDARPKPEPPERCTLHTVRSNAMKRGTGGVPGLKRLNPTKAVVQRGMTLAATRGLAGTWEPSVPATLDALFVRTRGAASAPPVPQASPDRRHRDGRGWRR
jgi:hypothetical protein